MATSPGTTNLIGWWELGEDGSSDRVDSHSTNDLPATNAPSNCTGIIGDGCQFVEANSEALGSATTTALKLPNDWSIGCWVYLDVLPGSKNYSLIENAMTSLLVNYQLFIDTSDQLAVRTYNTTSTTCTLTTSTLVTDTWYFCVATHEDNVGLKVYLNAGTPASESHTVGSYTSSSMYFLHGYDLWNGGYASMRMDQSFVYEKVLSADNIDWLYNSGSGRSYADLVYTDPGSTDLKAWWALEEASAPAYDSHDSYTLTWVNTVSQATGIVNYCTHFDRYYNSQLQIYSGGPSLTGDWSIGAWIYLDSLPSATGYDMPIICKGDDVDDDYCLYLDGTNKLVVSTYNSPTTTYCTLATPALAIETWYFCVGTHEDGVGLKISLNAGTQTSASHTAGTGTAGVSFYLGADDRYDHIDGKIDEAFIYEKTLTTDEISWLYNLGIGRAYSELGAFSSEIAKVSRVSFVDIATVSSVAEEDITKVAGFTR